MNVNELLFLGDENIDYGQLPGTVLHDLAVAEDPAVASSALRELRTRDRRLFGEAVRYLLESPATDSHLKAHALELSFPDDPLATLRYIEQSVETFDRVAWRTIIELMVVEAPLFLEHAALSCRVYGRFCALDPNPPVDREILDAFMLTYSRRCSGRD